MPTHTMANSKQRKHAFRVSWLKICNPGTRYIADDEQPTMGRTFVKWYSIPNPDILALFCQWAYLRLSLKDNRRPVGPPSPRAGRPQRQA